MYEIGGSHKDDSAKRNKEIVDRIIARSLRKANNYEKVRIHLFTLLLVFVATTVAVGFGVLLLAYTGKIFATLLGALGLFMVYKGTYSVVEEEFRYRKFLKEGRQKGYDR